MAGKTPKIVLKWAYSNNLRNPIKLTKEYWVSIVAKNGQKLFTSETYKSKAAAKNAIHVLICAGLVLPVVDTTKK